MAPQVQAQHSTTGDWNLNSNGTWSTTANWSGLDAGTDYPSGQDAVANIINNITATRTITLNVPVTLGILNIGDLSGGSSFTISGGTMTFDASSGFAQINKVNDGGNDTISSSVVIAPGSQLDITVDDPSNNQGIILSGIVSGGTNGSVAMTFSDLSPIVTNGSLNWLLLSGANTFEGQLVVNSGLVRLESSNSAAGAVGVGNETVVLNGGGVDLRDRDFNVQNDNTEIFMIAGSGPNGLGAIRNTTGTATISTLVLTDDAVLDSQGTIVLDRHLNSDGSTGVASVLDFGGAGSTLTKIGNGDFVVRGADILNANGASLTINEGEVRFESRGLLGGTGASTGINLDGLTVNIAYNRNPYDNVDLTQGSRTTSDLFGVNLNQSATQGNGVNNARFSVGSYWGASVTGTGTLAEQTKETLVFNDMTFNFNNGVFQREGNTDAGRTFDHIFNNVTINLVGGGVGPDAAGSGNIFDIQGGSGSYNSVAGAFDHPGVTEFNGTFDNTTGGNAGTGFTVRGSRELRITGDSVNFNGDILIKDSTGRWISNSFDRGNGGQAASVYTNMSLAGANGSFNQAASITITRWGSLALLNNSANLVYGSVNNDNRINDFGQTVLRDGFLLLETDVTVTNRENLGNVVADSGTNYLYLDTRAGGQFDGAFQSFTRNNGGVLKIYDTNSSHTFGTGGADDRIAVVDSSGITTVGANAPGSDTQNVVLGLFGGVLPTLATPGISSYVRPSETVQGSYMLSGGGTGLMTLDNGFLRPLTASEYNTGATPTADTNWLVNRYIAPVTGTENYADRNNYAGRNVTSDIAVNSLTVSFDPTASGQSLPTATKDYIIIENGHTLTINSGIINFISYAEANSANMESVIRGGSISMNGGAAIINSNALWQDLDRDTPNWYELMTGNSSFIRSHIVNVTDLIKTGRDNLYLDTYNGFTGNIYISEQSSLVARNTGALGAAALGREVRIGGGGAFLLEYGTNISGIDIRATNSFQGSATVLRNEGSTHSTWGGNIILDVADAAGSSEFQSYTITARNEGTLTVYGNIYTDHNSAFSDSDSFGDPPLVTSSYGENYTLNLRGQFRDVATGNLGTDPANAAITSIYRTGDSATRLDANHSLRFQMTGNDEGNVNVFQQWDATGRLQLERGFFRILYDPNAPGNDGTGFLTDSADALIQANDYYTRAALGVDSTTNTGTYDSHLMLTKDGQVFNWGTQLSVYNNNRDGTLSVGGENESGTIYIGSSDGASNYSIVFENQGGDRDLRFLQTRGGTMVINARLLDNGSSVNSIANVTGPGTIVFNANAVGASTVERWNFMGGEAIWQGNPASGSLLGNDRFGVSTAQAMFGGGTLTYIGDSVANRTENLTGTFRLLGGESDINVVSASGRTDTLNFGAAAAGFSKNQGGTLHFTESGEGTSVITLQATGLTNTGIMSYATYGSSVGGATDFASNGTGGVISAFTGYVTGASEANFTTGDTVDVVADVNFSAPASPANLRFTSPVALTLNNQSMTLEGGAILIATGNAGANSISGGILTSAFDADLDGAGTSKDLMIHNYGSGTLTVGATITDNGGDKVNLVIGGSGTTVLTGNNTMTGDIYLNNGVLSISSDSNLGVINGSIIDLARVNNGGNGSSSSSAAYSSLTNAGISFETGVAPTTGATGTFNSNGTVVTATSLTNGGAGYSSGVWVHLDDPNKTTENSAGVWAILDSGNLHFDGGTLAVTDNVVLDGARTLFVGSNGAFLDVAQGKTLTINGYLTSEFSQINAANGFTANHLGAVDDPANAGNPDIGDLIIEGGGTVVLRGAPNNTVQANMTNSYGGITWINEGTLQIASAGSSANGILGSNRSWIDGTIIGDQGSLEFATTSDPTMYEWLTFRGRGYEGRGTVLSTGPGHVVRLNGQMFVEENMLFNIANSSYSYIRLGESGGALYGTGDIARTGGGEFAFYINAPDWTGRFLSGSGTSRVTGSGSLQGMTQMSLDRNSFLLYSAGSTSIDEFRDRFADNLAVSTNGYARLRMESQGGVYSGIERLGTVTVNGGVFGIEYEMGADVINGAPRLQGDYSGWSFTDIVRTPGTVVQVRNLDPGTDISGGNSDLTNRALVLVSSGATVLNTLVGGDGSNGNTSILPGFFGGTRPEDFLNATTGVVWDEDRTSRFLMTAVTGTDPITGVSVSYLRPLSDAPGSTDYKIVADPGNNSGSVTVDLAAAGVSPDQNLRLVGLTSDSIGSGLTSTITSVLTLNSTLETNSVTFAANTTATNGTTTNHNEGNEVNLMMGSLGVLKIDSGVLVFTNIGTMDRLGAASNTGINLDENNYIIGGTIDFNGQEAIIYAGSEWAQYNVSGSNLGAYNNTDSDNTTAILRTSITNTGGHGLTKTGASSVTLEGVNSYTGDTNITMGNLYARNNQALGQSTVVNITGSGNFIIGNSARIFGVDVHVGAISGNNLALYAENEGAQWGGNVILDNVDATGSAGGFTRNFVPRIEIANSNTVFFIDGNIYGGDTAVAPGAQATSRVFTTYTDATSSVLDIRGQIKDKSTGAITPGNLNDVLRMEVAASNDLATVHLYQQYDSAGRISIVRGVLRYMGDGNFYTDAAAAALDPNSDLSGFQMGGRSLISTTQGIGSADVAFLMHNAGSTFNLSTWNVGVDVSDPDDSLGNGNYGLGNTTGNTTLGGENTSGTITFGTGTGSIQFTQADTLYNRNLNLYAARGGTVDMRVNFVDGGDFVNSSITKLGGGTMNLLGSSAGDSTVEALKMLGGTLNLTGYDVNASRRVGYGAALTLSGGFLIVDATAGTAQEDFGNLTLNSGGSRLAALGNATVNIVSSDTLTPASGVSLAFIEGSGGVINITASGLTTVDGERFGNWATYGNAVGQVTDWAAREGTTGVKAFTGYSNDVFTPGANTNVTGNATFASNTSTGSMKIGAAAALDLGGNTLTVENGGILVSSAVAGPVSIGNGTLTRNGAGDILLHNYNSAAPTTISANIVDNGGKVNLVTGGIGTTVLTGNNTYTGDTYINGGVLEISSESQLGEINGSIVRLVRENNGSNASGGVLTFSTSVAPTTAATGTYTGTSSVTGTTLTDGGSGYTTGIHVNARPDNNSDAGIWAILDSGNLHLDGGTLAVKGDITLDGARTIFLGASGGTFAVDPGKTLTINGYITSDVTDVPPGDLPVELSRPYIGGMAIEGGGTVVLTGAPDNVIRSNMYNGYNALTSINNGTLQLAGAGTSASNAMGTYGGWVDSTYIGANGTLLMSTTSDPGIYEWLTLDGQGYQGGGTIVSSSTARSIYLRGQIDVQSDAVFNLRNGSNLYLNNGGGETFGSGDIIKIGNGEFRFYGNVPDWTGNFIAASGYNRVYGTAGHVQGMSSMTLERNSYFSLEASSTTTNEFSDRLGDTLPVTTEGYVRMRMEATGGTFSGIEKLGTVTVAAGQLGIEADLGATLSGGSPVLKDDYAGWHFTEIVRSPGTTVQLRNFDAGTSFADSTFNAAIPSAANNNRMVVQVDVAPLLVGTGDGSNGNAAIAPGFYGGTRPAWVNLAGTGSVYNEDYVANRLVTVDTNSAGEHFLRPLTDSEYKVVGSPDTAQVTSTALETFGVNADQNLKIVGVTSDAGIGVNELTNRRDSILTLGTGLPTCPPVNGGDITINSLTFASESFASGANGQGNWTSLMLGEATELTISSGVIQVVNTGIQDRNGAAYDANQNMDIRSSLNGGTVNFAGQEANFYIGSLWVHYNTSDSLGAYRTADGDNNYFYMNSSIVNANGLTKTGSASLFLDAPNYYTGITSVNQGALYARHDHALGYSTEVNVSGAGNFVVGLGSRISGVDLYVGKIYGNNTTLQLENNSVWAGNVIIDNVDSAGATSYARSFTPRVFSNTTGLATLEGNIYGGSTPIGSGALTDSRMFSTYTGAFGLFDIHGRVSDSAAGAVTGPIDIYNQSQVLRMEVTANNNESAVQLDQAYDAAGRIRLIRGALYYAGTGDFYTSEAAATVNSASSNPMIGFQMGGRDVVSGNGTGAANLSFFLLNGGSNFNLNSWEVGVETYDPTNATGNGNYGLGNTTGNSTIGGVNINGTITFGTGDGTVTFTQASSAYSRDLGLFAARGGEVSFLVNFVDGGSLVNSSLTKLGAGQVNLMGSSAGGSTVESVNVMGGILNLTNYGTNTNRRVGAGASLTLAGGSLVMDGSDASFTENFGSLKVNQGGNAIAVAGDGVSNFGNVTIAGSSINRSTGGTVHFQSIAGGSVNFSNAAMQNVSRIGSYATFGANASATPYATDWAATDATGKVVAYTGYAVDSFGAGNQTDVQGANLAAAATNSVRFNSAGGSITSGTLTLNDGGMLIGSGYTGGTVIGAGVGVTTGSAGTDLIIHNFASGPVSFDGNITGGQNVVFTGASTLTLNAPSTVQNTVLSTTTATNSYTATVADTSGLTVGALVSGANIAPGTRIQSITDATHIVLTKLPTLLGPYDATYSSTSYATTSTYTGATHVTGNATVSFNSTGVFGSTSAFYLNGGTLEYSEVAGLSSEITQHITLGGGNGILSVTDPGSTLIFRGSATNQFSSETNNIIAAYGTNNPNAGGLTIVGSGTVQFGDRSAATTGTQDVLGVMNNYTGLTVIGDGVNPIHVDIQGQGNDNEQYTTFGTTESWADATIVRNNATIEFSMKHGDSSRDNQIRFREWFQIGEQAGDQILFDGSTQRQPTFDGILNIIGDLTFQTQGNRYADSGGTGNSEFLINPNEGGVMGSGNIIKLGDGNLRFYTPLHEWTGNLDIQDGFVGLQMNSGAIFNPNGLVYMGDPTATQTSTIQMRIENRFYGNNTTGLDSPNIDLTFNRDIIIRDNLKQEVRIAAGYLPDSSMIHFTNSINVGVGSSAGIPVRLYYEDNNNLDPNLVGYRQEAVFDITGAISGSNDIYVDGNQSGGVFGNGAQFIVWLRGDNSAYSGRFTVGGDNGTADNPGRNAIVRLGSANALGTNSNVGFRNYGALQLAGSSMTFTQNFLFTGGVGRETSARIENASDTAATITFDSGTKSGAQYQDVGVGMDDGTAPLTFGGGSTPLSVVKIGTGETVFGAATGGGAVVDAFSSYTGTTTVQQGTLIAGSNNAFSPYSRFVVGDGATLSLYWTQAGRGWESTIGSLAGSAASSVNIDDSTLWVGGDNTSDADYAGAITGSGFFFKTGSGVQRLSGSSPGFFGEIAVVQGTLVGSNNNAFGDPNNPIYLGGDPTGVLDAKVELLLDGSADNLPNHVEMAAGSGNDEGITVIGTRATSGTYGFGGTVDLYQDISTNVFFEADGTAKVQFTNSVEGIGFSPVSSLIKIGTGTVELAGANSYSIVGTPGTAIDGGTIIRHGTILISNSNALASTVVELGDTRYVLQDVYLATTSSLTAAKVNGVAGTYDAASDGAGGAGSGAFLNVKAEVDGVTLTAADVGKRILVKDEGTDPGRNGVYVVLSVDPCGTMTLVRASDFDEPGEMLYGSSIRVLGGTTEAGYQFFQASADVTTVDGHDFNGAGTDPVHWLQEVENPNISLLAGTPGMTVTNAIDINDTTGTGTTTVGGTFTSGTTYFAGDVTLQHSPLAVADNVRELVLTSESNDDAGGGERGVVYSGVISESQPGDTLSVRIQGAGTTTFTNDNTYSGKTTVASGTLALAGSGQVSATPWIDVAAGAKFDTSAVTGGNYIFDRTLSGSGSVVTGAGSFTVGTDGGMGVVRPGASSDPTSLAGAGNQVGTLTVSGNLVLAGSTSGTNRVVLQLGTSDGADYNDAVNFGTHLSGGDFDTWILTQGDAYDSHDSGNHDRVNITGSLDLNSGGYIQVTNDAGLAYNPGFGDVLDLLDWTTINANGFDVGGVRRSGGLIGDLDLPDLMAGLQYDTSLFLSHGIVTVVPEPSRLLLLAMAFGGIFFRRRRTPTDRSNARSNKV